MTTPLEIAARLCRHFEGLYLDAYQCPAGVWTVGYGHTRGVSKGQSVTPDQAAAYLDEDLTDAEGHVRRLVHVPLTPPQEAALISFAFNLGPSALAHSSLLLKLNDGLVSGVPGEIRKWDKCHVNGKLVALAGLTRRRKCEATLFATGELML